MSNVLYVIFYTLTYVFFVFVCDYVPVSVLSAGIAGTVREMYLNVLICLVFIY